MRTDRLLALATHLESGKLGHENFDYAVFNANIIVNEYGSWREPAGRHCGTNGCALGELPILFPDEWEFCDRGVKLRSEQRSGNMCDAETFFDIYYDDANYLFDPSYSHLSRAASARQVAKHIRDFVEMREARLREG